MGNRIGAEGSQKIATQSIQGSFALATNEADRFIKSTLPNGLAFARNGDILVSNFSMDRLEVMDRESGNTRVLYDNIDGKPIGKVKSVFRDSKDPIWFTISTMIPDWIKATKLKWVQQRRERIFTSLQM